MIDKTGLLRNNRTVFGQETAGATGSNGTNWVDLLDMSTLTQPTELWEFTLTIAGGWAGLCQFRIVDAAGNKLFPFADYWEQGTQWFSGVGRAFPAPIKVPVLTGYIVQFRSSNGADGAGQTCALTELAKVEVGY